MTPWRTPGARSRRRGRSTQQPGRRRCGRRASRVEHAGSGPSVRAGVSETAAQAAGESARACERSRSPCRLRRRRFVSCRRRRSPGSSTTHVGTRGSSPCARPDAERRAFPERRAVGDRRRASRRAPRRQASPSWRRRRGRTRRATRPRAAARRAPHADDATVAARRGAPRAPPSASRRRSAHPVSVHAMLRTVSFTLPVAARTRRTARSRSGWRSARSAGRSRAHRPPTRCLRAAPRRSGRCRR